ncbi:MAG TPA: DUF2784 domain-containing protein, partial [Gemmatimonadaceae bacterium]
FHAAFVLFVIFGGFAALRWRPIVWVHVPAAVWGVLIEYTGWICPLTPLENGLRTRAGEAGYSGDFVTHYLLAGLYPADLTARVQLLLGSLALIINLIAYSLLLARYRRNHERERA